MPDAVDWYALRELIIAAFITDLSDTWAHMNALLIYTNSRA